MKNQNTKNHAAKGSIPKSKQINKNTTNFSITSLAGLFFGLIALHFLFIFISNHSSRNEYNFFTRIWGFDNISFYPAPIFSLVYLIIILICIPNLNNKIVQFFSLVFWVHLFNKIKKYKYILFSILSVLAGIIIYYTRIKYHFLGDMDIRVKQTVDQQYISSEYLTMYLLHHFHVFLAHQFAFTGYQTFVLQSVIAGGVFIFFAFLISDLTGRSLLEKVVTFLFFISIGAILLFFGYVEIYSIPALSVVIYVYFSLLWVKNKTNFILPLLTLALAVAFHLMAIGLLPSFFIVLYQKVGKRIALIKNIKTKPFIILILILLPIAFKLAQVFNLADLMPMSKNDRFPDMMVLFSVKHFWEFLNSQILASGLYFFILVYFTYKAIKRKLKFDNIMWFYASASFFMLFITFVTNKMRGSGDWDICAFPALIYSPMVAYLLFSNVQVTGQYNKLKYALIIILVMNFANTFAWIGINAGDKSIKKIAAMLENDPGYYYTTKLPAINNLALSYKANNLKDESLKYYEKIYKKYYNDPNSHINYANVLMESGKDKEAAQVLYNLIQQAPYISVAYPMLFNIYQKYQLQDNIYNTINFLFDSYKTNPNIYLTNFDKKDLNNYFGYLYRVELQKKNTEKANIIAGVLNQIQSK